MKRKLVTVLALFSIVGCAAFAQTFNVWNEVRLTIEGSKTSIGSISTSTGPNLALRNRAHGTVTFGKFTVEARYDLTSPFTKGATAKSEAKKANLYWRPFDMLEIVFGNDYTRALAGGYITDARDDIGPQSYFGVAQYGKSGFTVGFTGVPGLIVAASLPGGTEFSKNIFINAAINYFIEPAGVNIGAAYGRNTDRYYDTAKGDGGIGVYVDFTKVQGLRLAAGVTYMTMPKAVNIGAAFTYDFEVVKLDLDFDIDAGRSGVTPFNIFGGVSGKVSGFKWFVNAGFCSKPLAGVGYDWFFKIKPGVSYRLGNHGFFAEAVFGYGKGAGDMSVFTYEIPVYWRYYFN